MKTLLIFGARPNYMKIAPLYRAMAEEPGITPVLVNTGQHFDPEMSDIFVNALGLPRPDVHLQVGAGTPVQQVARVLQNLEPVLLSLEPDLTIVVGDVNSTLAAALASATVGVPVAHVEAGLRSRDWSMPEERNRVLTDRLSHYLFTPSEDADENLLAEGIEPERIFRVGNVMIDTLDSVLPRLPRLETRRRYGVASGEFAVATLHRPSNVDDAAVLEAVLRGLEGIGRRIPVLFPIHPRTRKRLEAFGLDLDVDLLRPLPPLGYPEFISLLAESSLAVTDSGGIQEEATVLGVPCLTLRDTTERPITLQYGLNELVKSESAEIVSAAERALSRGRSAPRRPPLWDGHSASRIVRILMEDHLRAVEDGAPLCARPWLREGAMIAFNGNGNGLRRDAR